MDKQGALVWDECNELELSANDKQLRGHNLVQLEEDLYQEQILLYTQNVLLLVTTACGTSLGLMGEVFAFVAAS